MPRFTTILPEHDPENGKFNYITTLLRRNADGASFTMSYAWRRPNLIKKAQRVLPLSEWDATIARIIELGGSEDKR